MEELSLGEGEKKKLEISSQIFIHAREFKAVVGWREEGGKEAQRDPWEINAWQIPGTF